MDPGSYKRVMSYKGNKTSFDLHSSPCHPLQWCCQTRARTDLAPCKLSSKCQYINYDLLSPFEHSSGIEVDVCASQSHSSTNMQKWETSGTHIYKLSKHYSVTNDYTLGIILKQSEKQPTGVLQIYCKTKTTLNHKTQRKK